MLKKFIALVLAIIQAVIFFIPNLSVERTFSALLVLAVVTLFVNYLFHRRQIQQVSDFGIFLLPILWIFATSVIVFIGSSDYWKLLVVLICGLVLVRVQLDIKPRATKIFLENTLLVSAAAIFLGIWAIDFTFTPAWWKIMTLSFIFSLMLFWTGFASTPASNYEKVLYSFFLSFIFTEVTWVLLFWSIHFVGLAAVTVGLFYLAWVLTRLHFVGTLTTKRLFFYVSLVSALEIGVIATSVWLPQ